MLKRLPKFFLLFFKHAFHNKSIKKKRRKVLRHLTHSTFLAACTFAVEYYNRKYVLKDI